MTRLLGWVLCLAASVGWLGHAMAQHPLSRATPRVAADFQEVTWLQLVPPDWKPQERIDQQRAASLNDGDELAQELMKALREVLDSAPTLPGLDGKKVRMPGYIVPLETDAKGLREFLLVPYFGACIHTPPPPANQIVHVMAASSVTEFGSMSAVWVSGTMRVLRRDTSMGVSGYTLDLAHISAYRPN